jgi:hypothetical protein
MKRLALLLILLGGLAAATLADAFAVRGSKRLDAEMLGRLEAIFPSLGGGLYRELRVWKKALGEPKVVPQLDNGHTYQESLRRSKSGGASNDAIEVGGPCHLFSRTTVLLHLTRGRRPFCKEQLQLHNLREAGSIWRGCSGRAG